MKPATAQQKSQVFFMAPQAQISLTITQDDEKKWAAFSKNGDTTHAQDMLTCD